MAATEVGRLRSRLGTLADAMTAELQRRRRATLAAESVVGLGSPLSDLGAVLARRGYKSRSLKPIHESVHTGVYRLSLPGGLTAAVKVVDRSRISAPQRDEALTRETTLVFRLRHDHVVNALAVFATHRLTFILMELAEGGSLRQLLDRRTSLPVADKGDSGRVLLRQLVDGLAYVHGAGIAHRDIKTDNVFLDARGNARLGDFGFALRVEGLEACWCGSEDYNAPEVSLHERYDPFAADAFAFGGLAFRVCFGGRPFAAPTPEDRVGNQLLGRVLFPPSARQDAVGMLRGVLKADPSTRWTAARLASAAFFPDYRVVFHSPADFMSL